MVLKNDDHSGESSRAIDTSDDSNCEGDGSPPAKNVAGIKRRGIQSRSQIGIKATKNTSLQRVESRTELRSSSEPSDDSEMLQKSSSRPTSVEDNDGSFSDRRTNDASETVCSDRDKDDNNASCSPGTTNNSDEEVEAVDSPTISGSSRMPNNTKGRRANFKKHSQLLEATSQKLSSYPNEKSHDKDQRAIKSNKAIQSDDESDVDESDAEEEDVKVCDICGDAGREDLLAVCSRCSDGAEHTYCMRVMLDKVPEGEWLCEECKCNEVLETQKQDYSKKLVSNERSKSLRRLHSDLSLKTDEKDPFSERGKQENVSLNKQAPPKRPAERIEAGPTAKRQALESGMGSPTTSSRVAMLSKDSSFKNLDKTKVKPSTQMSIGTESAKDPSELAPSPTNSHALKGNFLKSNSFSSCNSRPNVKVSEDVLQNQKQGVDPKDGPGKLIGKSMSFKGLGRSNVSEPKVKMLSPKCAPVQDLKGHKQGRDRSSFERKNTIKLDHSLPGQMTFNSMKRPSRGSDSIPSLSVSSSRDYKDTQPDGKLKHIGHLAVKSADATASLGETKRPSAANIVGSTPVNGTSSTAEAKLNHVSVKDGSTPHSSRAADRPLSSEGARIDVHDSSSEKAGENSFSRSRLGLNGGVVSGSRRGLPLDASASRSKEGLHEENKLKAAIEAAMQKKQHIFKKNKIPEKSHEFSLSSTQGTHVGDAVSNEARDSISEAVVHERVTGLRDNVLSSCKQIDISSAKQLNMYTADFVTSPVGESVLTASAIPEQESVWQGGFEIHRNGKLPDMCVGFQAHLSSVASDEVLEVTKKFPQKIVLNEVPRPCAWPVQFKETGAREDNIALYFFAKDIESYMRNYKILLEYMMKHDLALRGHINGVELLVFPSNHLPHKSQCWNTLLFMWGVFRGRKSRCPDDRVDSLERPEVSIPNMVLPDKDAAPAGHSGNACLLGSAEDNVFVSKSGLTTVSGCEVPVSAGSNPQQSFNLSNGNCHNEKCSIGQTFLSLPSSPRIHENSPLDHNSSLGETCPESGGAALKDHCLQDPNTIIQHQALTREIGRCDILRESKISPSEFMLDKKHAFFSSKVSLVGKQEGIRAISSEDQQLLYAVSNNNVELKCENRLKQEEQFVDDIKNNKRQLKRESDVERKEDLDYKLNKDRGKLKSEDGLRQEGFVDINVPADSKMEDLHSLQYLPKQHLSERSMESISPAASMITSQKRPWVDKQDIPEDANQSHSNKIVKGADDFYDCDLNGDPSYDDRLDAQMRDVSTSSHKEDTSNEADVEKSTSTNSGSAEGCFFLVNSHPAQSVRSGDDYLPLRVGLSQNEDRLPDGSPNLELALGVKKKQIREGVWPFFAGVVDRNDPERPADIASPREEDEDGNASLSLSLAFPFSGGKTGKA